MFNTNEYHLLYNCGKRLNYIGKPENQGRLSKKTLFLVLRNEKMPYITVL